MPFGNIRNASDSIGNLEKAIDRMRQFDAREGRSAVASVLE
jgi:hypothetical protein